MQRRGGGGAPDPVDVDVSFVPEDDAWARWIKWHLDQAGYDTRAWSWDRAATIDHWWEGARQLVVVMSNAYLASAIGEEWLSAVWANPGSHDRLLLVLVENCELPGSLPSVVSVDLFGLDERMAEKALLDHLTGPPSHQLRPPFPGNTVTSRSPEHSLSEPAGYPAEDVLDNALRATPPWSAVKKFSDAEEDEPRPARSAPVDTRSGRIQADTRRVDGTWLCPLCGTRLGWPPDGELWIREVVDRYEPSPYPGGDPESSFVLCHGPRRDHGPHAEDDRPHFVPAGLGRYGDPFVVGVVGEPDVGKTSLLYAMVAEAQDGLSLHGLAVRPVNVGDHVKRLRREIAEFLHDREIEPPRNLWPEIVASFALGEGSATRPLVLVDIPGGWVRASPPGSLDPSVLLGRLDAVLFVIDGGRLAAGLSGRRPGRHPADGPAGRYKPYPRIGDEVFQQARACLANPRTMPAAVIVTKSDLLLEEPHVRGLLATEGIRRLIDLGGPKSLQWPFNEFAGVTAHAVSVVGEPDPLGVADQEGRRSAADGYHIIDPAGDDDDWQYDERNRPDGREKAPKDVLEPLIAVLAAGGLIPAGDMIPDSRAAVGGHGPDVGGSGTALRSPLAAGSDPGAGPANMVTPAQTINGTSPAHGQSAARARPDDASRPPAGHTPSGERASSGHRPPLSASRSSEDDAISELARLYSNPVVAGQLVERAGLARGRHPQWHTSETYWNEVRLQMMGGAVRDGWRGLLLAALDQYPWNQVFRAAAIAEGADPPPA
ncbi:toll/interleukin-1 receptor domain-containing protein [Frankia sp. CNm7]|uniref:Toll/interleukin-1 receptor domain-containing protein n=2 Tax=Frankia nepalensis TaxID=1836974 RepID=A0A937R8P3_9ACTN|nr:TIR domain-containing protein [Frankia nepalensis]MBL7516381.1 toll/interleukin-1 receptor domain-containing protein [Frankia nepalensis]MBL7517895.1 toll/interleukin-1 receptor domain-containing protein [Frankia nepalensis]MBL7625792.1 toll/interleukin-1 receptor domain-containing protein [Frankia nepalensis]